MKLYRTGDFEKLIEEIEIVKQTEKSVWVHGEYSNKIEQNAKHSPLYDYWDTVEEAKQYLTNKYEKLIDHAQNKISRSKSKLEELKNYRCRED